MEGIEAYKTTDGQLFEDHRDALEHQSDIVGELLDTLIPTDPTGRMTHIDRHNLLMSLLKSEGLQKTIKQLYHATSSDKWEECRQHVLRNH